MGSPRGRLDLRHLDTAAGAPDGETRRPLVWASALLLGSSVFAYLIGVSIHEAGHYLVNTALGVPESRIVLHPFDLSQTVEGAISAARSAPSGAERWRARRDRSSTEPSV